MAAVSTVNGYEISYTVRLGGRLIIETLNKDNAVSALVDNPGAALATKALK